MPRNLEGGQALKFVENALKDGYVDVLNNPLQDSEGRGSSHAAVAAALNHLVYYKHEAQFKDLGLYFGKPNLTTKSRFPLHISPPRSVDDVAYLKVGLCSGRHAELDSYVDCYLIEWHELYQNCRDDYVDREDYTRRVAYEFFGDSRLAGKRVELFHTGAKDLVVGAYHGIVALAFENVRRCVHSKNLWKMNALDVKIDRPEILRALQTLPLYFSINGTTVRWKLERPMTTKERDDLKTAHGIEGKIAQWLFKVTQFHELDTGGKCIWG